MTGMDWVVLQHSAMVHLHLAVAVLLPVALVAAQRPGRGIKPWWVASRYLAWAGLLGTVAAAITGLSLAHILGHLPPGGLVAHPGSGIMNLFRGHQLYGGASILLGVICLRTLYRRRAEHQGIGFVGLSASVLWMAATLVAGWYGSRLHQARTEAPPPPLAASREKPFVAPHATPPPADLEAIAPLRALDYLSLEPMHPEPVKSPPHANRWIRVWTTPQAQEPYREGKPLPVGSLVVMSSLEDRWGRAGFEPGPLYGMEVGQNGKTSFMLYWPRVPEAKRNETQGAERVYWRGSDPGLQGCQVCHSSGLAPVKDRSRWGVQRHRSRAETR